MAVNCPGVSMGDLTRPHTFPPFILKCKTSGLITSYLLTDTLVSEDHTHIIINNH